MTVIRRSTQAYFLPYEGRIVTPVYHGGNIFRSAGRFLRRNIPNLLRNIVPFIPRVADWIVTEGAKRGHIPESHRKIYEESLRPYVRYAPSLLRKPIDALDKKLNPTEQTTASTPTAQESVSQEGGRSVIVKHDFSVGGNITTTTKAPKKRTTKKSTSKKAPSKSKAVTKSSPKSKPKIGTAEYHKIIDQHIAQFGAGILQTSISHDMTHV